MLAVLHLMRRQIFCCKIFYYCEAWKCLINTILYFYTSVYVSFNISKEPCSLLLITSFYDCLDKIFCCSYLLIITYIHCKCTLYTYTLKNKLGASWQHLNPIYEWFTCIYPSLYIKFSRGNRFLKPCFYQHQRLLRIQ